MKLKLLLSLLLPVLLISCDDVSFSYSDDINSTIDKITFCPPDIGISVPDTLQRNMENVMSNVVSQIGPSVEEEAKKRDTWPINSIYLKTLTMTMKDYPENPANDNTLGFLVSVEIYISADGIEEKLWAKAENIPEKAEKIEFKPEKVNLKPYIDKGIVTKTKVTARYCPRVDIPINIHYKVKVGF